VTDQVDTAREVGLETVDFVSENATKEEGLNRTEVCQNIIDNTELQQQVAEQVSEDEVILNIELVGNCEDFQGIESYLTAQRNASSLPGVNVSEPVDLDQVCGDSTSGLHGMTGYPDHTGQFIDELEKEYAPNNVPENPDTSEMVDALEAAGNIDLDALPPSITPKEYVENCISVDIEQGRDPADVVFAIDTTGSMGQGDRVTKSWQTHPHTNFPINNLTSKYRSDTMVTLPLDWVEVRCSVTAPCVWSGGNKGDIVYDDDEGRFAKIDSNSPVFGDDWEVVYSDGSTDYADEDNLYRADYRLNAPEKMWFTQKAMKNVVDDLNRSVPDAAGLVEFNTDLSDNAEERQGISGVDDPSQRSELKQDVDDFFPDGGTDITGALEESYDVLDDDGRSGATRNIVLMTDGEQTCRYYACYKPFPEDYIKNNEGQYDNTFIHALALGDDPDKAVLQKLANDPNNYSKAQDEGYDLSDTRPEGTYRNITQPEDAEDIFEEVIGSIEDETEFEKPNASIENTTINTTASSGAIQEIYNLEMNITSCDGSGCGYELRITHSNPPGSDNTEAVWEMEFRDDPSEYPSVGHRVEINSDIDDSLDAAYNGTGDINDTYVYVNLPEEEFEMPENSSASSYPIGDAWELIKEQTNASASPTETVAIVGNDTDTTTGANGTFSFDFTPLGENFSKHVGEDGVGFDGSTCDVDAGQDIPTCGYDDTGNNRGAVSTVQVKSASFIVTVEGPGGVSNRTIDVELEEVRE
jgi:hypothetical protein